MKKNTFFFMLINMAFLLSCSKDDKQAAPPKVRETKVIDLSIEFEEYKKDTLYKGDTLHNNFVITNHDTLTLEAGDTLKVSCDLEGRGAGKGFPMQEYDLWLTKAGGQTPIILQKNLPPNDTLRHNPGYLLAKESRAYIDSDSLIIGLRVYGINNVATDYPEFSGDPHPENNRSEIVNTKDGTRRTK